MTPAELNTYVNFLCKTNDTTFPQSEKLVLANVYIEEISSRITDRDTQTFSVPYQFNLIADQREYAVGDDVLNRVHKVEIKFDVDDDRTPAYFLKDYRGSEEEDQITAQFTNSEGGFAYTLRRRAILILSGTIVAVTNGVRMVSIVFPEPLANLTSTTGMEVDPSTTTFGFPKQFHELLGKKMSIAWKGSQPKPIPLSSEERKYEVDLQKQLDAISQMTDEGHVRSDPISAEDSLNDGWDA